MGRLFYENEFSPNNQMKSDSGTLSQSDKVKTNLEKVAKLVPAEIIAAYLTFLGFIPLLETKRDQLYFSIICFAFCTLLTPFYLNKMSSPGKPVKMHLILSTIAFIVWAYVISGHNFYPIIYYNPAVASIVMVGFSMISGLIPLKS